MRLYLEVVPAFQEDVQRRWTMVKAGKTPPRLDTFVEHSLLLRRVATVASKEDREHVERMGRWFKDVATVDVLLWGKDENAYGLIPDELREVAASSQQSLNQLSQDLYHYSEWLSHHLD